MSSSDTVTAHPDTVFPDHESTFRTTDPELVSFFDAFALTEVAAQVEIPARTRFAVVLASLIAQHTVTQYRVTLAAALDAGVSPIEVKEILYQAIPYVGIARVVDALDAANDIFQARGIALPLEGQSTTTPGTRLDAGLAVQKSIFGVGIDAMYAAAPPSQLHIQQFLSGNCFGDYYTRTGLDVPTRELLTFSILLSLGGAEPQVRAHIHGNLNLGTTKATLMAVITQLIPYVGFPRALNAISCLNELSPEPARQSDTNS